MTTPRSHDASSICVKLLGAPRVLRGGNGANYAFANAGANAKLRLAP